ncbi:hypothetical protein CSUI_004066 [Cystoisospora suis]|uniref:Uncharacterized protein n=1 Tax=Cystoisospora suis TaxID=483139 RepID=A0A2C6L351_9APIC|nr:hypothetical protein CSUI_004066 [Cystoisospora suis]
MKHSADLLLSSSPPCGEAFAPEALPGEDKKDNRTHLSNDLTQSAGVADGVLRSAESSSLSAEGGGCTRTLGEEKKISSRQKNSALLAMPLDEVARTLQGKFVRSENLSSLDNDVKPVSKKALLSMSLDEAASFLRDKNPERSRGAGSTRRGKELQDVSNYDTERRRPVHSSFPKTREEDVERKLGMALGDIIENEKGSRKSPYSESFTRKRSVLPSRLRARRTNPEEEGEEEESSSLGAGSHAADPEERVNALLNMSLDAAAQVLQEGDAREKSVARRRRPKGDAHADGNREDGEDIEEAYGASQQGSRWMRRRRGRVMHKDEVNSSQEECKDYSESVCDETGCEAQEDEDGDVEDEEAESDDEEVDKWLRAFRRAIMMPLGVGTRGWKYLGEVGQEDTRAPVALILFSGSGRLIEEDIVTFFKPLSPTRILRLIPSSFFILIFPSIAAADAAVKQRSESCLHLLAAGAEQLRSLQAYERMLLQKYLEAEKTRLKNNGGTSRAEDEDGMGENEGEEVEMEEGEMPEGMKEEEDTVATTEKMDGENGEQGEAKGDNADKKEEESVEENGKRKEEQRPQKSPEVFWLLGDVEANLDANEKEHFLRQVDCWRRTLPIQSSVTPDRPARLLLRFATAEELRRCSAALADAFPEDADSLQKAASPGRCVRLQGRADSGDLSQSSFFGFYSREADPLLPMHVRDERPLSDMVERMRHEKNGLSGRGGGGGAGEGNEGDAEGRRRGGRANLEEKELARDQRVLTTLGGDFRTRFLQGGGVADLGEGAYRFSKVEPVKPGDPPVLVDDEGEEEEDTENKVTSWGRRLRDRHGRSLGVLERFAELPEPRPSPYGKSSPDATNSQPMRYKGRGRMRYDRTAPQDEEEPYRGEAVTYHGTTVDARRQNGTQERPRSRSRSWENERYGRGAPGRSLRGIASTQANFNQDAGVSDLLAKGEKSGEGGRRCKGRGFAYGVVSFSMVADRERDERPRRKPARL